ncbi:hypothetical protein wCauA_04815 [Wolbachia endosymbiont of Carposina sasakii]|uniref:hypothetical protein n=1 Tax=Wolbachia TaxID=953 RepID=UPI0002D24E83|nr:MULTISPECIES: hypothetical protein [unclassified Wolbachia]AGK00065.1 hypothetical protein wHa_06220 [Wolbachia endosymbiont of Drosophila simulans wHa]QDH18895.1 hypothetical protein wCauA_04815 [Wolbachia endosymbiont of Carposina sasakii]
MSILRRLLGINSNTPEIKEAIGFNPTNVELIEGNGVAYGLSYQDNGNGSSKVKLLISPLYQSKTYECGTNISVANEFKDQLSLTLIEDSAEIDKVGVIFPEEGISEEGEKCVKGLSFNTYGIKQSVNTPSVEHLDKRKLQKNIDNNSLANVGNSYFQPRAVKVGNGDVIVIAHNLKDQTLVSWYLKSSESGKFKVLTGEKGVTERKLFNFDNQGQLALNGNTMLYSQVSKRITKENQEVRKTRIFKFDMAKVIQGLKDGVNGFLLGNRKGQIDNKALSLSREHEISFLQYVEQTEGNDLVAFLENDQSANEQRLHIATLLKNGSVSDFPIYQFTDPIEQLYIKGNGQGGFIVTAVSGENIVTFNQNGSGKSSEATIIPANSIKTLSDFVNIINGRLTPDIISSSTVAPITVAETVVTSKKTPTAAITSTAETDAVKTTKLTTEAVAPTSTISKPSTESTTVAKTTTTSQATTVATTSTSVPIVTSGTETSTVKPTAATGASTSTMSKPSTESTTQTSTVTVEPTAPTTSSEKTTQTVFSIPSTRTKESTTPIFTTTLLPQSTSSPQPTQLAIGSNKAGMIGGSLVGAIGIVGIIGFIAYRYVKGRNAASVLELTDLGYRRRSSSSSDEEIFTTGNRMRTIYQSETVLNSISVESSSRSRSSSSSSSGGPGS